MQSRINYWCQWQSAKKDAVAHGIKCLVEALEQNVVEAESAEESFKTAYCRWVANRLIDSRVELRQFSALSHETKIQDFRKLDEDLAALSIDYIRAKLGDSIPSFDGRNSSVGYNVLSRELQKKMRHKPVRKLVEEIGDVLTTLTPCLLMSPLSVSQYLSTDNKLFDLVVFDEASQITVWDAIGAIARGKNVIVVGDPKQMPPTNFFDRAAANDDAEDETGTEDLESILDEALAAGGKLHRLTGHYRSRHESLIAFSNHRYYDGQLITYPCADTKDTAVNFVKVKGAYLRGKGRTNPVEAKAVVSEIIRRLKDPVLSKLTIGVVTFNSEQKKLIEDLLDEERKTNSDLEEFFEGANADEQVVVKNLETVQGHERDVILLSIGYGPDTLEAKTMPMNFGPLNRKGGERRLNVAITRAKSEMTVFCSFDPGMIDLTRTSSLAVRDLKHYLEFAQRGPIALAEAIQSIGGETSYDSDFEKAVAQGLRKLGWQVQTQIGVSKFRIDLGIVHPDHPGKYLAGIECDGAAYHSSPSAKDRDKVRHSILENLGWNLLRIWSTDYFIDPARVLAKTHEQLQMALKLDRDKKPSPIESNDNKEDDFIEEYDSTDHTEEQEDEANKSLANVEVVVIHPELSPQNFYDKSYVPVLRKFGCDLIDTLGPITFKHMCDKIARAHGFQRTGPQIKSILWAALKKNRAWLKTSDGHTTFWPESITPQDIYPYRGLSFMGQVRSWNDVPYSEKLELAMQIASAGNTGDLASLMATKIGLGRLHATTRAELQSLIQEALKSEAA